MAENRSSPQRVQLRGEAAPTARGEARKRALLVAARAMFLEQGYERTNINELVRRAGGSMATLYRYYGGKAGLFEAMMDEVREELLGPLTRLGSMEDPPEVFLTRLAEALLRLNVSQEGVGFYRVMVAEAYKFPELQAAIGRGFGMLTYHLTSYLDRQVAAGVLELSDSRLAAGLFFEMVKGPAQLLALMGMIQGLAEDAIKTQVHGAVDLFLHGCMGEPARAGSGGDR
ncbi:MAG: TetR/AcrR family transcriptional regulator [Burkholderiales bacterium]|nr:TetR/AcrR family transcriptional regulator [Burkholderiales bacterium]